MVKNVIESFKKSTQIFSKKQNNILSAAVVLMFAVLTSRILGLIRDRLLVSVFYIVGKQWQLDVYFAAFRIPDMIFQLLVMGALSAAFIPIYSHYLEKNRKEADQIARTVITVTALAFIILGTILAIFTVPISRLIAPNFSNTEILLMAKLTRIMLVAQFFFLVSNFYTGIIQSHQRFLIPAIAPILYNLGIIFGIIWLGPKIGILGPTIGVVTGALLHFLVQVPTGIKLGFKYFPRLDLKLKGVRKVGKLMLPRTLALAVSQLELTTAVFLASYLPSGTLSIFYLAQHLQALPIGLFGVTIGQAALPMLSKEDQNHKKFKKLLISSFKQIIYLAIPASVMLLVLRIPLVRIVFGAKNFPWEATLLTGKVIAIFSISVTAQAVIQILIRAYYALQNTIFPLIVGGISVGLNVILSFTFVMLFHMGVEGLAWAVSISSVIEVLILLFNLNKILEGFNIGEIIIPFLKISTASFLTGVALWLPMRVLDNYILDTTKTWDLIKLTIAAGTSGFAVYMLFSFIFEIEEFDNFIQIFNKFGSWRKIFSESKESLSEGASSQLTINPED